MKGDEGRGLREGRGFIRGAWFQRETESRKGAEFPRGTRPHERRKGAESSQRGAWLQPGTEFREGAWFS